MKACSYCFNPCRYTAERGAVCERCYLVQAYGFDRNRRDAERMANVAEMHFAVIELDIAHPVSQRCKKLGLKAYTVWSSRVARDELNANVIEEYAPGIGRVYQSPEAP